MGRGEQNLLHATKIAYEIFLITLRSTIFRDFVNLYIYFRIKNWYRRRQIFEKVIADRAESAPPDRNRAKLFLVLKTSWTCNSSFQKLFQCIYE